MKKYLDRIQNFFEKMVAIDKLQHFFYGAVVAMILTITIKTFHFNVLLVPAVTLLISVLKELIDLYLRKKEFSWTDIVYTNIIAVFIYCL